MFRIDTIFAYGLVHLLSDFIDENINHYVAGQLNKQKDYDESFQRLQDTGYLRFLAQSDPRARQLYTARSKGKREIYAKRPGLKINSDRRRKEAAALEEARKQAALEEARKQAELKAREEIAKLEAKSLAAETPFKLSADITAQYGVMNKITLIDHFNRRKIYKDSKHEYYYFLESMSLVFIGFPSVYWYKLNYDKSGKVYYYENNKPLHEGYLESLTAEKLFEFIAIALNSEETSVLFNEFASDERVINWCACVREFGKELYDMASEVKAQYNIPYSMQLYEVRGPGQMNYLDLEFGAFPGYSYNISFLIQFGHTDCSYVTEHIPADLLASLTAENLIDIIPVNHFCNTNEFISDERVIKWCECVRKFAEKLALGTEAKARSKKLKEYQTFINTDGR